MKESTKKKAGYAAAGAGALGVAGGAALLLRKKKLPLIGTKVSRSEVVKQMPIKLRQAAGRVVDMAARLDERLREFISTEEVPYGGGLLGSSYDKPSFPSLYLNRSADPGLMKLPGEGSAMVRYKVKRREIDESREDGQPLYGASIEIQSLEPVAEEIEDDEAGETEDLANTLFLREFGSAGLGALLKQADRSRKGVGKLMDAAAKGNRGAAMAFRKTKLKPIPMKDAKADGDFFASMNKEIAAAKLRSPFSPEDELRLKRHYVKAAVRKNMRLFEAKDFAESRQRDDAGRFAAGSVPGPQDYLLASAMAKRKKLAVAGAGIGALAGGAALARTERGREMFSKLGQGAVRAGSRMIGR